MGQFLPAARNEHAGLHFTWALLEEKEEEVWRGTFCEYRPEKHWNVGY